MYSTIKTETVLHIDRAKLWHPPPHCAPLEPRVFGYEVLITEGMNVVCLCHTRDSDEWSEPYQRVTVELRGRGLISLHPTPDLDSRWQALVVTDRSPLSLEGTALISTGFRYIRRQSDVKKWESQDPWVKRAHEVFALSLAPFRLSDAQRVLLLYNTSGIHRHSCISMCLDDVGHLSRALNAKTAFCRAFDWEFVADHLDRHRWYGLQWLHMDSNQYWEMVTCSHGVFDFEDMVFEQGYYEHSDSWNLGTGPDWYGELVPRVLSTWES